MPSPDVLATVYATDEDVVNRAPGDFAVLAPGWNKLAAGTDGVIGAGNLWLLTSASSNFAAQGVEMGHVVRLDQPATAFKGSGELFGVSAASGSTLTLRRLGMADGVGVAPSPAAGLSSIRFAVNTIFPTIEDVSFEINRRFGIDPAVATRSPSWAYDLRDLRQLCVLMVLRRLYLGETRTSKDSDFALKLREISDELSEVQSRVSLRWGPTGDNAPPTNLFTMRLARG